MHSCLHNKPPKTPNTKFMAMSLHSSLFHNRTPPQNQFDDKTTFTTSHYRTACSIPPSSTATKPLPNKQTALVSIPQVSLSTFTNNFHMDVPTNAAPPATTSLHSLRHQPCEAHQAPYKSSRLHNTPFTNQLNHGRPHHHTLSTCTHNGNLASL